MGKQRSKGVTFWGWLFIVSGIIGLLGPINPQQQIILYGTGIFFIGVALSAATLICGIFILKLNETARKVAIALGIIGTILIPFYLRPIFELRNSDELLLKSKQRIIEQVKPELQQKALDELEQDRGIAKNVVLIIVALLGIPLLILELMPIYFFTRPKVKEQFKQFQ
jgi:hypothetical protein